MCNRIGGAGCHKDHPQVRRKEQDHHSLKQLTRAQQLRMVRLKRQRHRRRDVRDRCQLASAHRHAPNNAAPAAKQPSLHMDSGGWVAVKQVITRLNFLMKPWQVVFTKEVLLGIVHGVPKSRHHAELVVN